LRVAAALWALSGRSNAQVNVERLRTDLQRRPFFANVNGSFTGRTGNVDNMLAGAGLFAGSLVGRHLFFLRAEGNYGRFEGTTTVAKSFAHGRYNLEIDPRWFVELFTQAQQDRFQRLKLRDLYGAGLRFAVLGFEDVELHLGAAYMLEYESIDVAPAALDRTTSWAHRLSTYLALAIRLDEGLTFTSTTYLQPRFDALSNYRVLDESSFEATLGKRLTAKLSMVVRYDSNPPTKVKSTDVEIQNSLGATF
jgi:hypothetical protein